MELTLRGMSFDFRNKAGAERKAMWNAVFNVGSVLASLAQRYMLFRWVIGFRDDGRTTLFLALIAYVCRAPTRCWAPAD